MIRVTIYSEQNLVTITREYKREKNVYLVLFLVILDRKSIERNNANGEIKKNPSLEKIVKLSTCEPSHTQESKLMGDHALNMYVNIMLLLAIM